MVIRCVFLGRYIILQMIGNQSNNEVVIHWPANSSWRKVLIFANLLTEETHGHKRIRTEQCVASHWVDARRSWGWHRPTITSREVSAHSEFPLIVAFGEGSLSKWQLISKINCNSSENDLNDLGESCWLLGNYENTRSKVDKYDTVVKQHDAIMICNAMSWSHSIDIIYGIDEDNLKIQKLE